MNQFKLHVVLKVFRFAFQPMDAFDLLIRRPSHFFVVDQALAIVQQCNVHTNKRLIQLPLVEQTSGLYLFDIKFTRHDFENAC